MSLIQLFNNKCSVCFEENLKWHYNSQMSQVEVFKCNHFTCKNCYQKMKSSFRCPMCRAPGQKYLQTFGVVADKPWNTLDEWKKTFHNFLPHSLNCDVSKIPKSLFGLIYGDLMQKAQNYSIQKRKDKKKKIKIAEQNTKRKRKADDRKNAVCPKCNTQCTSSYQMNRHINSNRCIKLQRRKLLFK